MALRFSCVNHAAAIVSGSEPPVMEILCGNMTPRPLNLSGWNGVCAPGERSRKYQRGGSQPAQQTAAFGRMALLIAWAVGEHAFAGSALQRSEHYVAYLVSHGWHCSLSRTGLAG
jgi:hypothetical protein